MTILDKIVDDPIMGSAVGLVRHYEGQILDAAAAERTLRRQRLEDPGGRATASEAASWSIAGVGVWFPTSNRAVAAVFVSARQYSGPTRPFDMLPAPSRVSLTPGAAHVVEELPLDVVAVSSYREHGGGPGDGVQATVSGTLGFRVTTAAGAPAITTAGHVVRDHLLSEVHNPDSTVLGTVTRRDCPSLHLPGVETADYGIVDLKAPAPEAAGVSYKPPPQALRRRSDVVVHGRFKRRFGYIEAICRSWIGSNESHGDWAEIIRIAPKASVHGESGAPVLLKETDEAIGYIVGGGDDYSLVQELDFALDEAGVALR